ncbi:MAG: PhzF family phenazine biosynthesis protein [Eubacteriales bacterium]
MIKIYNFKKLDAFTDGTSSGNPAGCIELDVAISHEDMLQIAKELKGFVSEVGYVKRDGEIFTLKYYSSEREVEFCGHATIAIMYDQIRNDEKLCKKEEVFINVNAGKLSVFNRINEEDAVYIMAPEAKYLECCIKKDDVARALKTDVENIADDLPIDVIDGGLKTLIIPINSIDKCISINPDLDELNDFCVKNSIDIIHIHTKETSSAMASYRTRVFAPTFGYIEDPATGSGNAAFGYYLLKNKLWKSDITIEQGPSMKNPNYIKLRKCDKDGTTHILFGGSAVKRIEGVYYLSKG